MGHLWPVNPRKPIASAPATLAYDSRRESHRSASVGHLWQSGGAHLLAPTRDLAALIRGDGSLVGPSYTGVL